ncbi:hypothetical protein Tco_0674798 [Tanacetum coccineum]
MENSKKGNLPLHHGIKISKDLCPKTDEELDKMSRVPYASAIGSIMYAMTCRRPDVSFALSMVSQHQHNPGKGHWIVVKNILKYLRNTKERVLVYGGEEEIRVTDYCDATVTWKSSKQDTVADSTCEYEYIAACDASKEAIWINPLPKYLVYTNLLSRSYYRKQCTRSVVDSWTKSEEKDQRCKEIQFKCINGRYKKNLEENPRRS